MKALFLILMSMTALSTLGHGGNDHLKESEKNSVVNRDGEIQITYERINQEYMSKIKPIIMKSCFDCHGNTTTYPWYYKLPAIKQLIDSDIEESQKHLNFSKNFPFISHDRPLRDLEAIKKSITNGSMPPFRYRIMHGDKKLTEDDIKQVLKWIKESKKRLE